MKIVERHSTLEAAQLRALIYLFAALAAIGISNTFGQRVFDTPEQTAVALRAHANASDAALLTGDPLSGQSTLISFFHFDHKGPAPQFRAFFHSDSEALSFQSSQAGAPLIVLPNVKRYLLFSCQKLEDPPLLA